MDTEFRKETELQKETELRKETAFRREAFESMAPVFDGAASRELTEDCVVPDTMPDVDAVTDAEGVLTVGGKETETDAVRITASLAVTVLYAPEGGEGLRSIELTLPAELRLDAPGADTDCVTVASLRVRSVEARAVNSRKISVRAEVEAAARCYRRVTTELAAGLADDGDGAHILCETAETLPVADVREKTFALTDEYQLPAGADGGILSRRVEAVVDDVSQAGGKAVFHGRVRSELLLSGEDGVVRPARYETEFSQIMETGVTDGEARPGVTLLMTGAYFDPPEFGGRGKLQAEFHLAAQCVCRVPRTVTYVADVYSNRTELVAETCSLSAVTDVRPVSMRQTVAGQASPAADGEIVRAAASVGGVTVEDGAVKTNVSVRLLTRRGDGTYAAARCRLPAEFTLSGADAGAALTDVSVTAADVFASPAGGGADVRVTLTMTALAVTERTITAVRAAVGDDAAFAARERSPSFTLTRVPAGTPLWPVARRCRSSVEAIAAANDGRRDGLLLIPKCR